MIAVRIQMRVQSQVAPLQLQEVANKFERLVSNRQVSAGLRYGVYPDVEPLELYPVAVVQLSAVSGLRARCGLSSHRRNVASARTAADVTDMR